MVKTPILLSLLVSLTTFAVAASAAAPAEPVEFSADTVQSTPQGGSVQGRLYVGRLGMRREYARNGQQVVEIVNRGLGNSCMLFPADRTYMERSVPSQQPGGTPTSKRIDPCAGAPQGVTCTRLGTEVVGGRQTEHWEIVAAHQGRTMRTEQWIDTERGIPLRQSFPGGSMELRLLGEETIDGRIAEKWEMTRASQEQTHRSTQWYDRKLQMALREELPGSYRRELRNVVEGPQPANLFELPAGYRPRPTQPQQGGYGQ